MILDRYFFLFYQNHPNYCVYILRSLRRGRPTGIIYFVIGDTVLDNLAYIIIYKIQKYTQRQNLYEARGFV